MTQTSDLKPRSRDVTDGLEKAAARGMLRAVGMGDDDFAKPQIGVASSWNEITPCNLSLDRLAQAVKDGVHAAGGYPLEFGTISVSDGISMGHEGMHFSLVSREVIADSVETVMQAERLDGSVLLAGCDKSIPGMLMAAARLDLASVFLYAGSIAPGWVRLSDGTEKDITIIDSFEAVGACLAPCVILPLTASGPVTCPRVELSAVQLFYPIGHRPVTREEATGDVLPPTRKWHRRQLANDAILPEAVNRHVTPSKCGPVRS